MTQIMHFKCQNSEKRFQSIACPIINVIKAICIIFCDRSPQKAQFGLNLGLKSMKKDKIDNIDPNNAF